LNQLSVIGTVAGVLKNLLAVILLPDSGPVGD